MLWLVVISACTSMYGYFSSFYRKFTQQGAERNDVRERRESAAKTTY